MSADRQIEADKRIRETERRPATFQLPDVVSGRLDVLVDLAFEEGDRTSRQELIAALICSAGPNAQSVVDALHSYRRMTVRDAVIGSQPENTVTVPRYGPGPRKRT